MEYVSPQYEQQLDDLAERLMAARRLGLVAVEANQEAEN